MDINEYLAGLTTETINPNTKNIDECSTYDILSLINAEDDIVPKAVALELGNITKAVDLAHDSLKNGGKMFYIGCGTSGRLGVLDASECPPTYGTDPQIVQGFIAGGDIALRCAVEGSEDDFDAGKKLVLECGIKAGDIFVGITASGSAPFVLGATEEANKIGAISIALVNNKNSKLSELCQVTISPIVGPEVIMGSTRMKSGTAQKLVLNMLSTAVMVKLGKVYTNLMVDLRASNDKLYDRSIRIICYATKVTREIAEINLKQAGMSVKTAILMIETNISCEQAEKLLVEFDGKLKLAIKKAKE